MLESDIEKTFKRAVEACGGITYKFTSAEAGVPDRIVVHQGRVILVELKRPDGEISFIQEWQHKRISKHGVEVHVIWSREDVAAFVDEVLE
jgi:hypothetical protein